MKKLLVILLTLATCLLWLCSCDEYNIQNTSSPYTVPPYTIIKIKETNQCGYSKYIAIIKNLSNSDVHRYKYRITFYEKNDAFGIGDTVNVKFIKNINLAK
jgi:hypothetical protein